MSPSIIVRYITKAIFLTCKWPNLFQVRRKRVARDYQLVARFYRENPIVQIGFGAKISPQKISNQVKAVKKGDGPKKELIEALRSFNQFMTAQEFHQVWIA